MITSRLMGWLPLFLPLYLVRFAIGPLPTTLLEIYVLGIIVAFLYEFRFPGLRAGWQALGKFRLPIIAWILTTLLAVCISPSLRTSFGLWRAYILEPAVLFFILQAVCHEALAKQQLIKRISQNLFGVTMLLTLWAIIQFLTGQGIPSPWNVSIAAGRRATGPFPYPNALALFVVPVGAYALIQLTNYFTKAQQAIKERSFLIVSALAYLGAWISVLLARSDGGAIALAAVTWLALMTKKALRPWLVILTILGLSSIYFVPSLRLPIQRELTFQNWSGKVRMYMWRDTIAMLKDHWFFGAGLGGYPTVFKAYQRTRGIEIFQYPHNILLNFWSETGLLGVLSFCWLLITWIYTLVKQQGFKLACLFPLLAILIQGLVDVPFFKNDLAILFWLLIWLTT